MKRIFFTERKKLMGAMEQILSGNADCVDVSQFRNKALAEKINQLLEHCKSQNNATAMRLNSAMGALGDNTIIKQTFDQVGIQSGILSGMQDSHQSMEASIGDISANMGNIRDNTMTLLDHSEQIVGEMTENIHGVLESTKTLAEIDEELQQFRKDIAMIHKIVDSVQHIAKESNILALNATIEAGRAGEAGKGFCVISENMRELALNVKDYAEEIGQYVKEIEARVEEIASSMNEATAVLRSGNDKTENSLREMDLMNQQLNDMHYSLNTIFSAIDSQTEATFSFARQMKELAGSNQALSKDCLELGKQMFKIGRYNDKTRSDLLKKNAKVSMRDWLKIFEVDHYVLTWRIYNNIVGFEQLKSSQVDNPNGCKLGKWLNEHQDSNIGSLSEFSAVRRAHEQLHAFALESFHAKESGNESGALSAFYKTLDSFYVLQKTIRALSDCLQSKGHEAVTEYVEI